MRSYNQADHRSTAKNRILTNHSRSGFCPFPSRSADERCRVILSRTIFRPICQWPCPRRTPSRVAPRSRKRQPAWRASLSCWTPHRSSCPLVAPTSCWRPLGLRDRCWPSSPGLTRRRTLRWSRCCLLRPSGTLWPSKPSRQLGCPRSRSASDKWAKIN